MIGGRKADADMSHKSIVSAPVAILMCTKDGATFLDEQLKSIAAQTHENWSLIVSDDGSSDETKNIVGQFAKSHCHKITLRNGPGKGASANFLSLANDPGIDADFFAFSDQDDIWHKDKIRRALNWLITIPNDVPGLYCGRTELMSFDGKSRGFSPLFARPPTFRNALVQNIAGGNTMVFNRAAKKLLENASALEVVLHDWWLYQLITGAGGIVRYDPEAALKYRQHPGNLIGSNLGLRAQSKRFHMTLSGRLREWNNTNVAALRRLPANLMQQDSQNVLDLFETARSAPLLKRLVYLKRSGVYRQTLFGNFGLLVAAILNKI